MRRGERKWGERKEGTGDLHTLVKELILDVGWVRGWEGNRVEKREQERERDRKRPSRE